MVAPALLTAVTVAAVWTTLALAVPVIATGDTAALLASDRPRCGRVIAP
jgi:hypothetical protein